MPSDRTSLLIARHVLCCSSRTLRSQSSIWIEIVAPLRRASLRELAQREISRSNLSANPGRMNVRKQTSRRILQNRHVFAGCSSTNCQCVATLTDRHNTVISLLIAGALNSAVAVRDRKSVMAKEGSNATRNCDTYSFRSNADPKYGSQWPIPIRIQ